MKAATVRIFNFGSINIDRVYRVDHMVREGETVTGEGGALFAGGKGANQSVAIARAGGDVLHVGRIGPEGGWIVDAMERDGVDVSAITVSDTPGGHAIIQVDAQGRNAVVVHGGANREIATSRIDEALVMAGPDDAVLVQNEISNVAHVMAGAAAKGVRVCFNPAPMGGEVMTYPLESVSLLFVNAVEAEALCGKAEPGEVVDELLKKFPKAGIVVTLGSEGAVYADAGTRLGVPGIGVAAVDTTGAGDTFIGYFMAAIQAGKPATEALAAANRAAALCVTRPGAQASIPRMAEVEAARL